MFTSAKKNAEATKAVELSAADLAEVMGGASVYNDNDGQIYYFTEGDGSTADRFASTYFNP